MAFLNFLFGQGPQERKFEKFTPDQQDALNKLLMESLGGLTQGGGLGALQDLISGKGTSFDPIERSAREGFEQKTIPTLAERFTALGGQRSSGFNQALAQAGRGLESDLASQRAGYGLQQGGLQLGALGQLRSLLGLGLTPQFENNYMKRQPGFLENVGVGLAGGLPSLLKLLGG